MGPDSFSSPCLYTAADIRCAVQSGLAHVSNQTLESSVAVSVSHRGGEERFHGLEGGWNGSEVPA